MQRDQIDSIVVRDLNNPNANSPQLQLKNFDILAILQTIFTKGPVSYWIVTRKNVLFHVRFVLLLYLFIFLNCIKPFIGKITCYIEHYCNMGPRSCNFIRFSRNAYSAQGKYLKKWETIKKGNSLNNLWFCFSVHCT